MRYIFIIILGLLYATGARAQISMQYVISSLGTSVNTAAGDVSYTGGEMALVTTVSAGGYTLTQGFQQMPPSVIFHPAGNLPVTLLDFSGTGEKGVNHLTWHTSSEIDNDRFEIARADETVNFKKIGEVKGAGTTNQMLTYTFDDLHPLNGTNYYRLKQMDYDGHATYSDMVVITTATMDAGMSLSIFPNPVHDQLSVVISMNGAQTGYLTMMDMIGHVVLQQEVAIEDGTTLIYIPLRSFAEGQYLFSCTTADTTHMVKVVKE